MADGSRRFQFSLRTLLVVALVIGLAGLLWRQRYERRYQAALNYVANNPKEWNINDTHLPDFPLERLAQDLRPLFPVQLSQNNFETRDGVWLACRSVEQTSSGRVVWKNVCFVEWSDGRVIGIGRGGDLSPTFVRNDETFLYNEKLDIEWLLGSREKGWVHARPLSFVRVPTADLVNSQARVKTLDEFEREINTGEVSDGDVTKSCALFDLHQLQKNVNDPALENTGRAWRIDPTTQRKRMTIFKGDK